MRTVRKLWPHLSSLGLGNNHKDVRAVKSKVKRAMDKNKPEKYVDSPSAKKQKIHEPGGGKKIKIYLYKIYIYMCMLSTYSVKI